MSHDYKVAYVEDEDKDLKTYGDILDREPTLGVTRLKIEAGEKTVKDILNLKPDLLLIDYNLRKISMYLGGSLAALLRPHFPGTPIIVISTRDVMYKKKKEDFSLISNALGEVDEVVYKDDLSKDPQRYSSLLIGLIRGFKKLQDCRKNAIQPLLELMGVKDTEVELLKEAWQFQTGADMIMKEKALMETELLDDWSTPQAARWILHLLFVYPGIFYDALHGATSLGISLSSFHSKAVQEFFAAAKYQGVFSDVQDLWWRNRLYHTSYGLLDQAETGPPPSRNFSVAFEKVKKVKLEASKDEETGEEHADTVCEVLKKPFLSRNTFEVRIDNRPTFMDPARVSFKALTKTNFNLDLLSDEERRIVRERLGRQG